MPLPEIHVASLLPVPELPHPINPGTEYLGDHLGRWSQEVMAVPAAEAEHWRAARLERLAGRMYPTAGPALLTLIGEAMFWLFRYDDTLDPGGTGDDPAYAQRLARQVTDVLDGGGAVPCDPLLTGLEHVVAGLERAGTPSWWRLCAVDLQGFADAMGREVRDRAAQDVPDPERYLAYRQHTSGWTWLTDLAELCLPAPLTAAVRSDPEVVLIRRTSGEVACAVNDLISLEKELAAGERHNLVLVHLQREGCSLRTAVQLVNRWSVGRLALFLAARDRLRSGAGSLSTTQTRCALAYTTFLEALMRGSLDWSLESGRYRPVGSPADPVVPARAAERGGEVSA